eukprot:6474737-Amphidinium_carterae.2
MSAGSDRMCCQYVFRTLVVACKSIYFKTLRALQLQQSQIGSSWEAQFTIHVRHCEAAVLGVGLQRESSLELGIVAAKCLLPHKGSRANLVGVTRPCIA